MPITIAWHLTFSSYASWLPGDERGYVERSGKYRNKVKPADAARKDFHASNLKHPEVALNAKARRIVREAIEGYCEFKGWKLYALNVRTNHVHAIVAAVVDGSKALNGLKARATRLLREAGQFAGDQPVWSARGHKHGLASEAALKEAIHYVLNKQGPDLAEE